MRERFRYSGLFFFFLSFWADSISTIWKKNSLLRHLLIPFCLTRAISEKGHHATAPDTLQPSLGPSDILNYSGERLFSCRSQPGIRSTSLRANTAIASRSSPLGKFFVPREFLSPRNARSLVATGRRIDGCVCRLKIDHFCFYIVLWAVCLLPVTRCKVNWKLNVLKRHDSQKRKDFAV